jgi:MFS family permease
MTTRAAHDSMSGRAVLAAAFLTSICLLPAMLAPYMTGAAARDLSLDTRELGFMAMALIGGVIAVMASSVAWIRRVNWRAVAAAGAFVAMAGFLLAGQARSFALLLAFVSLASLGTGMAYAPAIAALGESDDPDRSFGYAFFLQIILSGIAGFVATQFSGRWGLGGVVYLLGGAFGVSLAAVVLLPERSRKMPAAPAVQEPPLALPIYAGLAGILLLSAGPTANWVFFERIGESAGLPAQTVGNVIALGLLLGAPGALFSATVSARFGRIGPLAIATLLMIATFIAVVAARTVAIYLLCALAFQFLWNFTLAFQYGAVSQADVSGRLIVLAPVCQGIGAVFGSGLAGELVHGGSYWPAVVMAAITSLAGLLLILRLCRPRAAAPLLNPEKPRAEKLGTA